MAQDLTVYRHINSITNETFYIGIGSPKRPYQNSQRSRFWNNYVDKHKDFYVDILGVYNKDTAIELEKALISYYGKRINNNGPLVNITDGGEGFFSRHTEESKKKMSTSRTGKKLNFFRPVTGSIVIDNVSGKVFKSISSAAREYGINKRTLTNWLTGISPNKSTLCLKTI